MRRLRDIIRAHAADAGGEELLSEGQRAIIRRAALLQLQLEMMEARFAENNGEANAQQIEVYQRASNSLRRLVESVGLHRGRAARDVTPSIRDRLMEAQP